MIIFLVKKQKR